MCAGSGSDDTNTVERQTGVDTFKNTRNVGSVSREGHSGLSTTEAASIALDPTSKLSSPLEKGVATAQMAVPGGLVLGGLRTLGLRSHGGMPSVSSLLGSGRGKSLLGG